LCTSTDKISMTILLEILIPQNASTRAVHDSRLYQKPIIILI